MPKNATKKEPVRHTHATINGIEDAEANAMNIISELEIAILRAKRLLEILHIVRRSPHAYRRGSQKTKRTYIRGLDNDEDEEA